MLKTYLFIFLLETRDKQNFFYTLYNLIDLEKYHVGSVPSIVNNRTVITCNFYAQKQMQFLRSQQGI